MIKCYIHSKQNLVFKVYQGGIDLNEILYLDECNFYIAEVLQVPYLSIICMEETKIVDTNLLSDFVKITKKYHDNHSEILIFGMGKFASLLYPLYIKMSGDKKTKVMKGCSVDYLKSLGIKNPYTNEALSRE
jgi:hypothetical protein